MLRSLSLKYRGSVIDYSLTYSARRKKTVSIRITAEDGVIVRAPERVPLREVNQVVAEKAPWILKKMGQADRRARLSARQYTSGELFKFLGRNFPLVLDEKPVKRIRPGRLERGCLIVIAPSFQTHEERAVWVRKSLERFFESRAEKHIHREVARLSKKIGISPDTVLIKNLKSSWGICRQRNISFNWRLIMAPTDLVEYVVAHELCHLKHNNHSREFYSCLRSLVPDYQIKKKELHDLSPYLRI